MPSLKEASLVLGDGTWRSDDATLDRTEAHVGVKIARGAAGLWERMQEKTHLWFC
jgi:putative hydrolases of HD superfamily